MKNIRDRIRRAYRREFVDDVAVWLEPQISKAREQGLGSMADCMEAIMEDLKHQAESPRK